MNGHLYKVCIRCSKQGHLSHACKKPNPKSIAEDQSVSRLEEAIKAQEMRDVQVRQRAAILGKP
jgi:hypothetical protein